MAFNANEFRNTLKFGGARASLFEVALNFPDIVGGVGTEAGKQISLLGHSSTLPGISVEEVAQPYFGRDVNFAPDGREYDDWSVTVINDEDFLVRFAFETWQNLLTRVDHSSSEARDGSAMNPMSYVTDVTVRQFSKDSTVVAQYMMKNAFAKSVAGIDVSWGERNTMEEFEVTFAYDYLVIQSPFGTIGEGGFSQTATTPGG